MRLAALSPETSLYTGDCIGARWAMGEARRHLGDYAQATEDARAAQAMVESELAKTPDDPDLRKTEVAICDLSGDLCEAQAQPVQARDWYKRAQAELQILANRKQISNNEAPDFAVQHAKFTAKLASTESVSKTTLETTQSNSGVSTQPLPTP